MVDFIYDFIQLFSGIIPRNVFWITEHCFLLKFVLEKRLRGKDILEEERKNSFLMVYRFADDLIRCVHNEDASPLRSYSDSSSLSSTCMPTWMTFCSIIILVPQFQEYSRQ